MTLTCSTCLPFKGGFFFPTVALAAVRLWVSAKSPETIWIVTDAALKKMNNTELNTHTQTNTHC